MDEYERIINWLTRRTADEMEVAAAEAITRLLAELAECKRDAERYRWLRASSMNQREIYGDFVMNLDDAIDAALRGEE